MFGFKLLIVVIFTVNEILGNQINSNGMLCAYTEKTVKIREKKIHVVQQINPANNSTVIAKGQTTKNAGKLLNDSTQQCSESVPYCYTLWYTNVNSPGNVETLLQGCWTHSGGEDCSTNQCIANSPPSVDTLPNNTRFCCCKGNFCNQNVTDGVTFSVETAIIEQDLPDLEGPITYDPNYKIRTIGVALAIVFLGVLIVIAIYVAVQCYSRNRYKHPEPVSLGASRVTSPFSLDCIQLDTLISGGRFSDVYVGRLHEKCVALKTFIGNNQRQYYSNERSIYGLSFMEHDSLLKFYGSYEDVTEEGQRRYMIVLQYMHLGTLSHYLKLHALDWVVLCRMCLTVAAGLSHLHREILLSGKKKPAIAHRDLNSRNVLVREDLGCVICDFGFAMQIEGSRIMKDGTEHEVEQSALTDVGTRRYMAPEILEGAVNLRDCEASLKQIDVYALGLLFWEIGTRCKDMYQGLPVPEYKLPFQEELGAHPTFEDMQQLVSKNKARPLFPNQWKDCNPAIRAFKETIDDCWDQDGEARLTALCIEERIIDMEALWSRKKGTQPISTSNFELQPATLPEKRPELCNVVTENGGSDVQRKAFEIRARHTPSASTVTDTDKHTAPSSLASVSMGLDNSLSSRTTDTLLTPLENKRPPNVAYPPNSVYFTRPPKKPLYSHQGENPTVARNTHKSSDEDLQVRGNILVNKCHQWVGSTGEHAYDADRSANEASNERVPLAYRARIPLPAPAPRIPFMQNDVASELIVRPKQSNVQHAQSFLQKIGMSLFKRSPACKQTNNACMSSTNQVGALHSHALANPIAAEGEALLGDKSNLVAAASLGYGKMTEVCVLNGQAVVRAADQCSDHSSTHLSGAYNLQLSDSSSGHYSSSIASDDVCLDMPNIDASLSSVGLANTHYKPSLPGGPNVTSPDIITSTGDMTEGRAMAKRPDSLVIGSAVAAGKGERSAAAALRSHNDSGRAYRMKPPSCEQETSLIYE